MKRKASIIALTLALLLVAAQGAFAHHVFLSFSTNGGAGIGVEFDTASRLSAVLSLHQKGVLGGLRYQLAHPGLYVGGYLDSTHPKGGFAASIGTRIADRSGALFTFEGGLRSHGDLFLFGTVGWRF